MRRSRQPLYQAWRNMFRYCRENRYYRGVGVCYEWRVFEAFEKWCLANGWRRGLMVARVDKDADFSPGNCRIVTMTEFNGMRRCVRRLEDGRTLREATGVAFERDREKAKLVRYRVLEANWDIESALAVPRMSPSESIYIGLATMRRRRHCKPGGLA